MDVAIGNRNFERKTKNKMSETENQKTKWKKIKRKEHSIYMLSCQLQTFVSSYHKNTYTR